MKELVGLFPKAPSEEPGQPVFKFLVASRSNRSVEDGFNQVHNFQIVRLRVEDDIVTVSDDIILVVKQRLRYIASLRQTSWPLSDLERQLIDKADRTFLWVKLVLDMLKKAN